MSKPIYLDYNASTPLSQLVKAELVRLLQLDLGNPSSRHWAGVPVAATCHGPWMLIEADVIDGRKLTSWPSLKTDIINAGGTWLDEACVCDAGLITSRSPKDLSVFCEMAIKEFAKGVPAVQPELSDSIQ